MTEHDRLAEFKQVLSERELAECRAAAAQRILTNPKRIKDGTLLANQVINGRRDTHYIAADLIRTTARNKIAEQAKEILNGQD